MNPHPEAARGGVDRVGHGTKMRDREVITIRRAGWANFDRRYTEHLELYDVQAIFGAGIERLRVHQREAELAIEHLDPALVSAHLSGYRHQDGRPAVEGDDAINIVHARVMRRRCEAAERLYRAAQGMQPRPDPLELDRAEVQRRASQWRKAANRRKKVSFRFGKRG
jgi:hypothetical protein